MMRRALAVRAAATAWESPNPQLARRPASAARDRRAPIAGLASVAAGFIAVVALAMPAAAREWVVAPDGEPSLAEALAAAADGDRVRLLAGTHAGPLTFERSIALEGEGWPVIDGGGRGTVITVVAPGVRLSGLVIRGSGDSLDQESSGIAVEAARAEIRGNRLEQVLFGIYLREAPGSIVAGNRIAGMALDLPRRGDAIRVWQSDGVRLEDNEVDDARDVVLWYSSDLVVRGNRVRRGRYGLHFMYCDDAEIAGNLLVDNSVGAFLMYSRRLRLAGNTLAGNHGPSGYGVGLKDMDDAWISENLFVGNRVGAYLDNSPREMGSETSIEGNAFAANDVGVLLMPNVRRARLTGNSFLENGEQVAVGGAGGDPEANTWRGNHWSDYAGYDADGDGVGELAYRSEKLFESLADRSPALKLFRHSPAAEALDFAARAFPVVRPRPEVTDPEPRMRPVLPERAPALERRRGDWTPAAAGLVGASLLLLGLPAIGRRGQREGAARRREALARGDDRDREPDGAPMRESGPEPAGPPDPPPGGRPEGEPAEALIEARGLTKRFGDTVALDALTFRVARGESVALWGSNGAGKTTALRALLGILPIEGEARVAGLDVRRRGKAARRRIGYVPQEIALQGDLSVAETLELFARLRRAPRESVERLVGWLELDGHLEHAVRELSGGLKQRLALGLALVSDPPILFLDEPTSNLDPAARAAFFELLLELREAGKTLVFTSHRVDEVRILADRVLVLAGGRLSADGPVDGVALDGPLGGRVHVRIAVAEADRGAAAETLLAGGFGPRRIGPYLEVEVAADRKAAPLAELHAAGVEVLDFELVSRFGSGERRA